MAGSDGPQALSDLSPTCVVCRAESVICEARTDWTMPREKRRDYLIRRRYGCGVGPVRFEIATEIPRL